MWTHRDLQIYFKLNREYIKRNSTCYFFDKYSERNQSDSGYGFIASIYISLYKEKLFSWITIYSVHECVGLLIKYGQIYKDIGRAIAEKF